MSYTIPDDRVWTIKQVDTTTAQNIITIAAGSEVELAFDFRDVVQHGGWLETAVEATIEDDDGVAQNPVSGLSIDWKGYRVLFTPPTLEAGSYSVEATALTTNGETLAAAGGLHVI